MNKNERAFAANNVAHCFSNEMKYTDFLDALTYEELEKFRINSKTFDKFMLSNNFMPRSDEREVYHLEVPVHFCIKHKNQGKIESYKWFFKGFCDYMQPEFCQMVDVGSIPLQGSISSVIMHMEAFPNVGGACGEIE
jgi:cellulose synthase/poly-beta-1,6-N-acetylglucosamine synthase-like glycosyltransferase